MANDFSAQCACSRPSKKSFRLLWLNSQSGRVNASSPLAITHDDPRLELWFPQGEKLWAFAGKGQHDPPATCSNFRPPVRRMRNRLASAPWSVGRRRKAALGRVPPS